MQEYSRILIEEYCMTPWTKLPTIQWKEIDKSYKNL